MSASSASQPLERGRGAIAQPLLIAGSVASRPGGAPGAGPRLSPAGGSPSAGTSQLTGIALAPMNAAPVLASVSRA